MANKFKRDKDWVEAKRRCQLNQDDIRKAKELGLNPRKLIKNIPSKSQQWKAPVKYWIRDLYEKQQIKIAARKRSKSNNPSPAMSESARLSPEAIPAADILFDDDSMPADTDLLFDYDSMPADTDLLFDYDAMPADTDLLFDCDSIPADTDLLFDDDLIPADRDFLQDDDSIPF